MSKINQIVINIKVKKIAPEISLWSLTMVDERIVEFLC